MNCPVCGGTMIGDGYTTPIHCENVDINPWIEPDFGPIYCMEEPAEMSDEEYAELLEETYVDTRFTYPDLKDYELDRELIMNKICIVRGCNNPSSKDGDMCSACQNESKKGGNPHLWSESCLYKSPYGCIDYILYGNRNCRKCMTEKEMYEEAYDRIAEQAYQHELDRDLELDRDYEANMPLSPSGTGKVYGGSDDIPF